MGGRGRAFGIALAFLVSGLSLLVGVIPTATAATRTWTTDADFNEAGAVFDGTQVVGTGDPASIHLLKDSVDWQDMNPAASPGLLQGAGFTFSAETGVSVLFGGRGSTYSDRTWEYTYATNTWTQIPTAQQPSARRSAGLSYDPVTKVVVLFGGSGSTGALSDTWEYNVATKTWTQYTPSPSPPALVDSPLVYDSGASRHILAGWYTAGGTWETWAYDASTHTWQNRAPSVRPGIRSGHGFAYSPGLGASVMFGGSLLFDVYNDTWEYRYSSNTWVDVSPSDSPSTRTGVAMTYSPILSSVLMYGGNPANTETWVFDGSRVWSRIFTGTSPPPRQYPGFTFDTTAGAAVMYGGVTSLGDYLGDTWTMGASYRTSGKYTSAAFDSLGANVDWQYLWWNLTSQPPGTTLQFQLAASNSPGGPFIGRGPDGAFTTFYTTPGTAIWSGLDNQRYLVWFAELRTTDSQFTPDLADVTVIYNIPDADPYIVSTDPADATTGVPLTKIVRVVFSKPMDTATVGWSFLLGVPVTFTPVWSGGDTILDLTHPGEPFAESQPYRLLISGQDLQSRSLVPNPIDPFVVNPFTFVTAATYPYIVAHTPNQGDTNVPLPTLIVVDFSEAMDTASVSAQISPTVPLTPSWSLGDTRLTMTHPDFVQCAATTVQISGRDKAGLSLVPGPVPNPWSFTTECINPYITATQPMDLQGDVAVNAAVIVDFSEPMNRALTQMTIVPSVGGSTTFTWTNGDRTLTMTHPQAFTGCQRYDVTVTGVGVDGNPLIAGPPGSPPNPWKFFTVCSNPYIISTTPEDGAVNVSLTQEIIVAFSEAMDTATVTFTISPAVTVTGTSWDVNQVLHIDHTPFNQCTRYTVQITGGRNTAGLPLVPGLAPNPWSFDTICVSPQIIATDPADGELLVPVDQAIRIDFSKTMDTRSVGVVINPFIDVTRAWSNGDRTLTLTHTANFLDCTEYEVSVTGNGADGNPLVPGPVPNPWRFTTRCVGFYIVRTDPADLEQNVPFDKSIVVEFSQPVDTATFQITLAPSVPLTPAWSAGDTVATLSHTTPFPECRWHTATVVAKNTTGSDLQNVPGSKPNPWTFRTTCIAPQITLTNPADLATDVPLAAPIVVDFSEPMLRSSVTWTIAPSIALAPSWSNGDRTLTLTHASPFQPNTLYTVSISGTDLDGVSLAPGPVPNPWSFRTGAGLPAPAGLQVIRLPPADVLLTWRAVPGATDYVVFSALSRFQPWPWPQLAIVTTTAYTAAGHLADGSPHYYIVRARDSTGAQGANSTMGVKQPLSFSFSNSRSNIYWLSLPYRTMYRKASDVSNELTSSQIDVVAKWNPATQSSILWFYFRGGWRGTDFSIAPGDGIYIGVRSSFPWVINGTDGAVARSFTLYSPPNANVNWISLPYTSTYVRASDIVLDIEGSLGAGANTKIVEVARWDPLTQSLVRFYWTPTGWTGTDFTLGPGEGVYLRVVASFAWTPRLITPEVP